MKKDKRKAVTHSYLIILYMILQDRHIGLHVYVYTTKHARYNSHTRQCLRKPSGLPFKSASVISKHVVQVK